MSAKYTRNRWGLSMTTVHVPAWMSTWAAGWSNLSEPGQLEAVVTVDTIYEDVAFGDVVKGKPAFQQLLGIAYRGIPDF